MVYYHYMSGEVWVTISDMDDYKVSNFGRVQRLRYGKWRVLKPETTAKGYQRVMIPENQATRPRVRKQYVHIIVARHFLPAPQLPGRLEVDHGDGNRANNHASNLEWVTPSENVNRAYARMNAL